MTERSNGAPNVLIIDDEAGILDSLRILLKNEGFTPHVALGGKQGLDQIQSLSPDIVLSDVRMPTVSGLEVLAAARQKDPDTPVILMTAQATLQSAMQAVNEGASRRGRNDGADDGDPIRCRRRRKDSARRGCVVALVTARLTS